MEIVYDDASLDHYMKRAVWASPERPVLIDRFIEDAIEVDVDMVSDGHTSVIGGIMEHIEEAGRALGGRRHGAPGRTPFRTGCWRRSVGTPCGWPRSSTWSV